MLCSLYLNVCVLYLSCDCIIRGMFVCTQVVSKQQQQLLLLLTWLVRAWRINNSEYQQPLHWFALPETFLFKHQIRWNDPLSRFNWTNWNYHFYKPLHINLDSWKGHIWADWNFMNSMILTKDKQTRFITVASYIISLFNVGNIRSISITTINRKQASVWILGFLWCEESNKVSYFANFSNSTRWYSLTKPRKRLEYERNYSMAYIWIYQVKYEITGASIVD